MADQLVTDGMVVSMDYTLTLDDGQIIDTSEGREPLVYLHGHGQIIPGLEKELAGMAVGASKKVSVAPEEGYGEVDPNAVQLVEHNIFPDDLELKPGQRLQMATPEGHPLEAEVVEIKDEGVLLDFNHPLAGETLTFDVSITNMRAATADELSHGHAHGPDGHHHH